ncbi:NAD(P)-dependent dehydrogenase (short-subunit alcohol dehydrogenase family) [Sphingobium sp. OAS761]|uniref:SDR family NAD(P)-dependent oxidoreductase n=1 Tax=Sphingobium sp. OAS761 TaxID=2817901 RepID=UPI00209C94F7|nr:SDR family oxidoreductase [Sphingobium sp. OAS761]MCP1471752.1 NAD(P)-dependent dehydrogenase (short-subunit alcohol dehydrogenase family) [Sphingobium sp. OAS761]
MTDRLARRRIIVIGSATGIGAATVRRLMSEGAHVCAADINVKRAEALAQEIGGNIFALHIDIADEASVTAAITEAVQRLGGLDGVHVNAADMRQLLHDSTAIDVDLAVFDRTIAVNLRGHLLCTRAVLPHLLAGGSGAIVYTSSDAADWGEPVRPCYAMAKSGLNALMRHVSAAYGKQGITANCIAPGFTVTPEMADHGITDLTMDHFLGLGHSPRVGEAEDQAAMVAHLLSSDGRWITGQVYHVNGGQML